MKRLRCRWRSGTAPRHLHCGFLFFHATRPTAETTKTRCARVCAGRTQTHTSTHSHKHTHAEGGAQLRAATAGACCWSEDWSCRPRYSLRSRGTATLETARWLQTGWIRGEVYILEEEGGRKGGWGFIVQTILRAGKQFSLYLESNKYTQRLKKKRNNYETNSCFKINRRRYIKTWHYVRLLNIQQVIKSWLAPVLLQWEYLFCKFEHIKFINLLN